MKILHIAAHLGGGVGKAHAALAPHMPHGIDQTFALLEDPIDRRHVEAIRDSGAQVRVVSKREARRLAEGADIAQFEYWGHPALDDMLDGWRAPSDLPTVCWCHVSGLHGSPIAPQLLDRVDRFIATSPITLSALRGRHSAKASVCNSGFGFEAAEPTRRQPRGSLRAVYLGTVGFKKLHPEFFAAIDALPEATLVNPVALWGHVSREASAAAQAMRRPERIELKGHTLDPSSALTAGDIFLYPLRRDHFGTAENALIEAMSLGLVPIVLDNPAETAIVAHGKTGIVCKTIEDIGSALRVLTYLPALRVDMAANAMREIARTRSARRSAAQFVELWTELAAQQNQGCAAYA